MKKLIRLTEGDLHKIIKSSVKRVLQEADWKTYMNGSKGFHDKAEKKRKDWNSMFPHTKGSTERNSYDDKADELEKYANEKFNQKHGKNGYPYNYEGESPSYQGRYSAPDYGDIDFDIKNEPSNSWIDDETGEDTFQRKYRNGKADLGRDYAFLHDDTFDAIESPKGGFSGGHERRDTRKFDKNGESYSPDFSTVGDEISQSTDSDYLDRQNAMAKDLNDYYTGKSHYTKGKGWD